MHQLSLNEYVVDSPTFAKYENSADLVHKN